MRTHTPRHRLALLLLTAVALTTALGGCRRGVDPEANNVDAPGGYDVTLRWTDGGIPHVRAADWGSLGFGVAYVAATDNLCTLAREFLRVRGEQSAFLGPDEGRREADVLHRALLTDAMVARAQAERAPALRDLARGYVAGYNRYLKDHPDEFRSAACRGAAWVHPIALEDLTRLDLGVAIRYGLGRAAEAIVAARPPPAAASPNAAAAPPMAANPSLPFPQDASDTWGSNALAFGGDTTASRRGLLLGNPLYPWHGASRFHLMHLTIPGVLDVMGAGLITSTLVNIGFNADVAWTHTVSSADRATLYALQLVPGQPLRYRWGDAVRALQRVPVTLRTRAADGSERSETHAVYMSHLGPVVADEDRPWTAAQVYVLRDANLGNGRSTALYQRLATARSVDDVQRALRSTQAASWVNTVAADRAGNTLYADVGAVPNLDYAFLLHCRVATGASIAAAPTGAQGRTHAAIVLRGDPACEWPVDPNAAAPGLMPPSRMPALQRRDYVLNSNDSHWLANARQRLEGYSPIFGEEGTARSLRTRAGLAFVEQLQRSGRITAPQVQALVSAQRVQAAASLLPDMLAVCKRSGGKVELANGNAANAAPGCAALARWDGTFAAGSRGALLWAAFWPRAAKVDNVWRQPFSIADPVHTPAGLNLPSDPVREGLLRALVEAMDELAGHGIPLDAPLGEVQYVQHGDERIPIPGGPGRAGAYSVIDAEAAPGARRYDVRAGNSYVQVVGWDAQGKVQADAMLTYGQSKVSDGPAEGADDDAALTLTRRYAKGEWTRLPFTEAEIAAATNVTLHLLDAR